MLIQLGSLQVAAIVLLPGISQTTPGSSTHQDAALELHVKFVAGTDTRVPLDLLPPELADSVEKISPLFTLSEDELARLGADRLKLWYRITLEHGTDVERFLKDLEALDVVETVERAPEAKPPPEPAATEALLVEFRTGVNAREPLSLLPAELAGSVLGFEPVSELRYRIDLKPGTDVELFNKALRRLETVVSAERVPRAPPPPL
jgi:hypothetical protein